MSTSESDDHIPTFSIDAIRLFIGLIAFALPVFVTIASSFAPLTSISASYYTAARNIFVGLLFVLGAFLFTYKGHDRKEDWMANLAALGAITAALFPTYCNTCQPDITSNIHLCAGATMFLVTAWFCLGPFKSAASAKPGVEAKRRVNFYKLCGWVILICVAILGVAGFVLNDEIKQKLALTFFGEVIMLWTFSAAWLVASQWLPWFTDKNDKQRLHLSREMDLDNLNLLKDRKK